MTAERTATDTDASATDDPQKASDEGSGLSTSDLASARQAPDTTSADTQVETRPAEGSARLFSDKDSSSFRDRWTSIQASFVDDPRQTVQEADSLVADTIQRLAQVFADERNKLEDQWSSGGDVSTEALRIALQRYRSFFDRLLSV